MKHILNLIEKEKISEIEHEFNRHHAKGVDIVDFTRMLINIIDHNEEETIFTVIALVETFKNISESINMSSYIKF